MDKTKIYQYAKGMALNFGTEEQKMYVFVSGMFTIRYEKDTDIVQIFLNDNLFLYSGTKDKIIAFDYQMLWLPKFAETVGLE